MNGSALIRVLLGVFGALLLLGGVALALFGGGFITALWLIGSGIILIIVAVIEIGRYRSEAAERLREQPGPGGGETALPEPRFRRTDEVFVDPTSQRRMRVFADPNTGERRYVAEG